MSAAQQNAVRVSAVHSEERRLRVDLAAVFRLAVLNDWHEAVVNHFSVAVSDDGKRFLMNPKWRHFSRIKASDLLLLDAGDRDVLNRPDAPDPSAWCIHGAMHASVPHARCILHAHPPYGTALSCLADPAIKPVDQTTARFFNRVAIDLDYGGIADQVEEGRRLARVLGDKKRMILGNHGVLVAAPTVAEAFNELYFLERACRTLMLAYSSGQPLSVLSPEMAEHTAKGDEAYVDFPHAHFAEMKRVLDESGSTYAS